MSAAAWEPTIGLEVHVQLATRTKLFCRCAWQFGAEPNSRVCPVCLGHPGVLPVANQRALELGARAALSLGMQVQAESKFDRKNYFYPDLPKGYQISQFDEPLGRDGSIVLDDGTLCGIERLHLEEDAGKAIHDRGDFGLVDFNRAGAPLAEIVGRPDIHRPGDAREYLEKLKQTLRWAAVSDCDMEKGNLRVDVNVSVAPAGQRATGTRTEIKNVNSFASVVAALEHEIARQTAELERGGRVRQETRTWDDAAGETRVMRSKEGADDYRYFPDPDLPRLRLTAEWIDTQRRSLPGTTPEAFREHCLAVVGLSPNEADMWSSDPAIRAYHLELVAAGVDERTSGKWITNEVLPRLAPGEELGAGWLPAARVAEILLLTRAGRVQRSGARAVLDALAGGAADSVAEIVAAQGLETRIDPAELEAVCARAIEAQPRAAADVRAGKEKALGALLGFVMRETSGAADAAEARRILLGLLEA